VRKADEIRRELMRFGSDLRRLRVRAGLTQERLAELANLNTRTVQEIEAGDINILLTAVVRLRKALRCSSADLFGA